MKHITFILFLLSSICFSQDFYTTKTGVVYKIGDTIKIGQPLSHLGWRSIFRNKDEDYMTNKNIINKKITIHSIDTINKPVNITFIYKRTKFKIDIDDALRNKEVIPQFKRSLANEELSNKYDLLIKLKTLLDSGALTQEEYDNEKKKILNTN